jgi:7-cyano-7-deazaguanine synthase
MAKLDKILCMSGGMDSVIAWYYLEKPPCIFFNTKLPYSSTEYRATQNLGISCIVDYSLDFSQEKEIYIPHRNLLFASRASVYAQEVVIAGLKDDCVEDKTPAAFDLMSYTLSAIGKEKVRVTSPFWQMTKSDLIKWAIDNVVTFPDIFRFSISCYNTKNGEPCYSCPSCFRKACALNENGIYYPFNKEDTKLIHSYRYKAETNWYIPERNQSILKFIADRGLYNG